MSKTSDLLTRREAAVTSGVGHVHPIVAERAENAEIWDVDGKRWIDFASGIGVVNTGHLHPKVKAAAKAQLDRFSHTCVHVAMYEEYIALAERLNAVAPGDSAKKTLLLNSGAEAVENAVKVARRYTGRTGVIAFDGAFHGRTLMTMSLTGRVVPYKAGFGPFVPEVFHAPFPNERYGIGIDNAIAGLEQLFKSEIERDRVAAFIIEPVQGEGGFYPVPNEFLQKLRTIADESGIVLIADEIQCGFGRTGKMFACEHAGVEPDIITLAKGLAGGFPISAIVGKAELMDAAPAASLGGTYGGNPVSCVAALAVLDVMEQERLPEKAAEMGEHMIQRLNTMVASNGTVADVRGLGSLVALEFFTGEDGNTPAPEKATQLLELARSKGLILLSCGVYGNVIRFLPPLTIEQAVLDEGLDVISACLGQMD
ncbi:MAG: 4-aminobutyrate--2-oxoglutarate transaminase [Gammaproteobacteria bacterium]|nr:4-aminobutyrate--2-oxoglutarate transaminase [Gammaproteobacteria bacterium]